MLAAFEAALASAGGGDDLALSRDATEAIRHAAVALIAGQATDEIDEGDPSALHGYRCLRRGAAPEEHTFPSGGGSEAESG